MSELAAKRGAVPAAKKALFLVFRIGNERFALKATEVAEVLPRLPLKPIAHAPAWVAGIWGALLLVRGMRLFVFGGWIRSWRQTRLQRLLRK